MRWRASLDRLKVCGVRPAGASDRRPCQAGLAASCRGIAGGTRARLVAPHRRVGLRRATGAGGKPVSSRHSSSCRSMRSIAGLIASGARAPEGAGRRDARALGLPAGPFAHAARRAAGLLRAACARLSGLRDGWASAGCRRWPDVLPSFCGRRRSTRRSWASTA